MTHGDPHTLGGLIDDLDVSDELDELHAGDIGGEFDAGGSRPMFTDTVRVGRPKVSRNREDNFDIGSGRVHDPRSGEFEPGSPPPDLDTGVDRYRRSDGRFKSRSTDLYDEPAEVLFDSLWPRG